MKETFLHKVIRVLGNRRMAVVLLFGFSSGIPLGLTGSTLQAWMTHEKIDLKTIGIFTLVGLPYTLKFLWSPLMDAFVPPFLGRRRGWLILTQMLLVLAIAGMAVTDPAGAPVVMATIAFLAAFFSASQDIVVDAYRTDVLNEEEYGLGSGTYIMGYRIGMLVSGALALILADQMPWRSVYFVMAMVMGVGVLTTVFLAPEPELKTAPARNLRDAVYLPFREFLSRKGSWEVLSFIILYKLDVVVALALSTTFLLQLGFSNTDIGAVNKGVGLVSTIVGTFVGGAAMTTLGMRRSLWTFGILQGLGNFIFVALARVGQSYPLMVAAVTVENLLSGMGTAAYSAFLMSLCSKRFSATQYALLTSLMALTRVLAGAASGFLAARLGWEHYFLVAISLMIPGLLLLTRYSRWSLNPTE